MVFWATPGQAPGARRSADRRCDYSTVTTDIIDFANIESGKDTDWKKINDPAQLAVIKPAIHLGYFDVFSDDVAPSLT